MNRRSSYLSLSVIICGFLLCPTARAACVGAPPGLIHWWRGESGARDWAGTNDGILEAGVTVTNAGEVGSAFVFNGSSGGVNLGNVPDLEFGPGSSFSFEAWFNSFGSNSPGNDGSSIIELNYHCSNTLQSLVMQDNIGVDSGRVFFYVRDINGVGAYAITAGPVSRNQFHHAVGVREVNGPNKTLTLYIDGVLADSVPDPSTGSLAADTTDYIGRRVTCGSDNVFNGIIDEVSIYNRALTSVEVQALYNAGSGGKCFYAIDWFKVAGGGGISSDGVRTLAGTIGQHDAGGPFINAQFSLVGGFWALPIAIQVAGAPVLTIVRGGPGLATISWSPATPGFHLQLSDSLNPSNWSNAPSGATNPVSVPAISPQRFYRLASP
jgi:hypothetical protein